MECKDGVCFLKPKVLEVRPLEVTNDAVMLEWTPREGAFERFQVDMREGEAWKALSEQVKSPFLRKKNLTPAAQHEFRVRGFAKGAWSPFSQPCSVQTLATPAPPAPAVRSVTAQEENKFVATLEWKPAAAGSLYEVQMRRMNDASMEWVSLSQTLKGAAVKKKNLLAAPDYIFRVRSRESEQGPWGPWSLVSQPAATPAVNPSFRNLFGAQLLRRAADGTTQRVPTDMLAGKIVLVYFSAHWCPPCRQQTAMMQKQYPHLMSKGLPVEIVFVSADRDQAGFDEYFGSMPWLAVPYESPMRQQAMSTYQVSGIPKLMVFSPSGRIISDNAAGAPITDQMVSAWLQQR